MAPCTVDAAEARPPALVWLRAPRTPEDLAAIETLRIPGAERTRPQGIVRVKTRALAWDARFSRAVRRPMLFATPAPDLAARFPGTYGVPAGDATLLPNIVTLDPGRVSKSAKPLIVFLGRLDPIKRPWIVLAIAERLPDVDFA